KKIGLERTLGLLEVTISGVGIILWAGIYALIDLEGSWPSSSAG
ncbi:MAG: hypothetical protein QG605_1880, partial [Euryarchaeota archaeon]|nr:hypothetical protein [Euryarchaeota archaeon]